MKFSCFITGLLCLALAPRVLRAQPSASNTHKTNYTMQQQTINKSIIRDFYRRTVGQGDIAFAEQIIADDYIQHSSGMKPGKAGLMEALAYMQQMPKPVSVSKPFLRLIAEGDYVVTNLRFDWGGKQKVVVDIFRFQNGKVAEHWDAIQDQPDTTANGHALMDGPLEMEDFALTAENKQLVSEFYKRVFIGRQLTALPAYTAANLIQHTPVIADGIAGLRAHLSQPPGDLSISTIHRVIAEGNFVVVQAEGQLKLQPTMFYDIFRLDQGYVVEHWGVKQARP